MTFAQKPPETIVHPTDLGAEGASAFAHALKIALTKKAQLCLLHVRDENEQPTGKSGLRRVRDMLVSWGLLKEDAEPAALEATLGLRVSSVSVPARNARAGILDFLDSHPCDLVVVATHPQKLLTRWFEVSAEHGVLRQGRIVSLFLRDGGKGFVDAATGALALRNVLIPIDERNACLSALLRFEARIKLISPVARLQLLHVGQHAPNLIDARPESFGLPIIVRPGPVVETIFKVAADLNVNLIAMPTAGRHGLLDAVRGSTTARILEDARWPMVAIPAD